MGIYKNSLTSETEELYLKEIILENYTNIFKVGRKKKGQGEFQKLQDYSNHFVTKSNLSKPLTVRHVF